jgi:hypothetical protein
MKGFIPLNEFARAIRVHWRNAYRMVQSGKVRARSERRGEHLRWLVDARDVAAILKDPPWKRPGHRGIAPKRVSGPAKMRVNNPARPRPTRKRRHATSAFKRLP